MHGSSCVGAQFFIQLFLCCYSFLLHSCSVAIWFILLLVGSSCSSYIIVQLLLCCYLIYFFIDVHSSCVATWLFLCWCLILTCLFLLLIGSSCYCLAPLIIAYQSNISFAYTNRFGSEEIGSTIEFVFQAWLSNYVCNFVFFCLDINV